MLAVRAVLARVLGVLQMTLVVVILLMVVILFVVVIMILVVVIPFNWVATAVLPLNCCAVVVLVFIAVLIVIPACTVAAAGAAQKVWGHPIAATEECDAGCVSCHCVGGDAFCIAGLVTVQCLTTVSFNDTECLGSP
jgi:hypothetical protein